jgi:hypothetical protein
MLMKAAYVLCLAAMTVNCASVSDKVDDLATVELGPDVVSPIEIERSVELGAGTVPACLDFSATLPSTNTTVALKNGAKGCELTLGQPDMVLMDEAALERARDESSSFDVSGIRGGSIEIQKLELSTTDGSALKLADYVDAVSVEVDGDTLLDRVAPSELQGDANLTRQLPASVIDKLKASLRNDQVAMADVVLRLWFRGESLPRLPDSLHMLLVLQPTLEVNVVAAAL